MKKQKKANRRRFKATAHRAPQQRRIDMQPEAFAAYMRRAEDYVIPKIKEFQMPPGPAFFLLAQYTHVLITGDERITLERASTHTADAFALWTSGIYTPGPNYPYTLEETMRDQQGERQTTRRDYADCFQPFRPVGINAPKGLGHISGGLVKHPETSLWQVWLIVDGPCGQIAAYHDALRAQQALEELILFVRSRRAPQELGRLYKRVVLESDGLPKQIPFEMIEYLLDHLDQYAIPL